MAYIIWTRFQIDAQYLIGGSVAYSKFKILYDSRDSNVGFNYLVNKMLNFRIIQNDENELETYN